MQNFNNIQVEIDKSVPVVKTTKKILAKCEHCSAKTAVKLTVKANAGAVVLHEVSPMCENKNCGKKFTYLFHTTMPKK